MEHDNIALVRRWFEEVWNQRRSALVDELLTDESVCHAEDGPMRGAKEFRERLYSPFLAAFPDFSTEVEAAIAQGDHVVVRWTATGRHTGGGLGIAPTGQPVFFRGITWVRAHNGKLVEGWQSSNIPEVLGELSAKAKATAPSPTG